MKEKLLLLICSLLSAYCHAQFCTSNDRFTEIEYFNNSEIDSIINITYGTADDYLGNPTSLYIDAYFQDTTIDPLSARPLILMIHGGGFTMGNYKGMRPICVDLAKRGFVAVTMSYRLGYTSQPNAMYRAQQDANAALRYLMANNDTYQIDTSWCFIGGRSAGAVTANIAHYFDQSEWNTLNPGIEASLGSLNTSGNSLTNTFSLKGIFNNWGAVPIPAVQPIEMVPQIAFHGLLDNVVQIDSVGNQMGSRAIHYNLLAQNVCSNITIDTQGGHGIFLSNQGTSFRASKASCFFKSVFCNSCVDILTTDSIPDNCSSITVGLSDLEVNENHIVIYPNPVSDQFTINGDLTSYEIEILNSTGQIYQTINSSGNSHTIDISSLPSGIYFVRIQNLNNNLLEVQLIIKE